MAITQIKLPDVSGLAVSGTTIQLMEALSFSSDGKHLVVKATFTEDGSLGELRYGYFLYDLVNERYVANLNEHILSDARLTTSNIESLSFIGTHDDFDIVAEVKDLGRDTPVLVTANVSGVVSEDILTDALGADYAINVESFRLAEDRRHLVVQTSNPNLASVLNPDTNDSSDVFLIDLQTLTITRVSEIGGAEVNSDTFLEDVAIVNGNLQISFVTDEAYASISRIDQNTTDTSGPIGTRTDAYLWQAPLSNDGSIGAGASFTLISASPDGTASGFVDIDAQVVLADGKQYFSSASELIDIEDNNNAVDAFLRTNGQTTLLDYNGQRFDANTQVVAASDNGRFVLALSQGSQVSGSTGAQQLVFFDTQENTARIVSENSAGNAGDNFTINGVISSTGSQVAFTSLASNLTNELPNAFAGSLFVKTYDDINKPPQGDIELATSPIVGESLALDFTGLIDEDGLPDLSQFNVEWFKNGESFEQNGNVTKLLTRADLDATFSAVISYVDGNGNDETVTVPDFGITERPTQANGGLDFTAKYIVFESDALALFDLSMDFDSLNYLGQSTLFSGFSTVDAIKIDFGQMIDITNLKGSSDKLYLPGNLEDYLTLSSIDVNSGVMTLISTENFTHTEVKFIATPSASDDLVFANGKVSSTDIKNFLLAAEPSIEQIAINTSERYADIVSSNASAQIKAIALDDTGEVFTSFTPNTHVQISGGGGVDKVFINVGTQVDATNLKSSIDEIYMQGDWADYTKTFDGSGNIQLTRQVTIDGSLFDESISVASGSTIATNDLLVFADGAIRSADAVNAIRENNTNDFTTLDGYISDKTTPIASSVSLGDFIIPSAKPMPSTEMTLIDAIEQLPNTSQSALTTGITEIEMVIADDTTNTSEIRLVDESLSEIQIYYQLSF